MRTIVITGWVLSALVLAGCDKSSGSNEAPAQSASANAAVVPTGSATGAAAPSASAKAEAPPAKPEGHKEHASRMKALDEAFASHEPKKIAALYAEDAVVKTAGQPEVKGRAAIEKDAEHMFAVFKDAKVVHGRIWEKDKHTAVVESVFTGTNTGDSPEMGIAKATNKTLGIVGASWLEINDEGFIKEEHRYHDSMTGMGQLVPDKKNPVRPVVSAPPDGTEKYESREAKEAKEDKEKAEHTKAVELEKKNLEIEAKWVTAMGGKKLDEAYKLVGDDILFVDYTQPADIKGKKAFKDMIGMYMTAIPDMKAKITSAFGAGEFAVVEFEYTGTQKGALGPIKATNKAVDLHQLEVDEIKDGKFVKGWAWGNNAEMLSELGLLPGPGAAPGSPPGAAPGASAKPATPQK